MNGHLQPTLKSGFELTLPLGSRTPLSTDYRMLQGNLFMTVHVICRENTLGCFLCSEKEKKGQVVGLYQCSCAHFWDGIALYYYLIRYSNHYGQLKEEIQLWGEMIRNTGFKKVSILCSREVQLGNCPRSYVRCLEGRWRPSRSSWR